MLVIRTAYVSNSKGTGQIVAKGGGRQRTITYDHSRSSAWNHGVAAGTLVNALEQTAEVLSRKTSWEHDSNDAGTKHGFNV